MVKKVSFLNTMTGEIGELCINVPVDEMGRIDMTRIDNFRNNLIISDELKMVEDGSNQEDVKRLIFGSK